MLYKKPECALPARHQVREPLYNNTTIWSAMRYTSPVTDRRFNLHPQRYYGISLITRGSSTPRGRQNNEVQQHHGAQCGYHHLQEEPKRI